MVNLLFLSSSTDVQFRTATPVHMHAQRNQTAYPNDDDSASSSSSSSSSDDSAFPSSPYTYQSTHRTTTSSRYAAPLGTTASAIPGYLQSKPHRSSMDYNSSLTVPRAPSPRRVSADYERPGSKALEPSRHRHTSGPTGGGAKFTTSSYQPPAPAFLSRPMDYTTSLRLPPRAPLSSDSNSLTDSIATLSVADNGGSGYNQFASVRPPKLDGTALDAGVHGMKRSWDGFKREGFSTFLFRSHLPFSIPSRTVSVSVFGDVPLTFVASSVEVKFGARGVGKKLERKLRAI